MKKFFNVFLEFDRERFNGTVENAIKHKKKGYVCVVDGNVLATANKDVNYREIINDSLVNSCDGSSIAFLAGIIHNKHFTTYTGPEIFEDFTKNNFKQIFLGNTKANLDNLKQRFSQIGYNVSIFKFMPLPFKNVENFDYISIANVINDFSPDIIWISLGAPKQEFFIDRLYPFIDKGVLFAIGAAFNFFLNDGKNKRAPLLLRIMHLEWLFRLLKEPNRVGKRALKYLMLLPGLILGEIRSLKDNKTD